LGKIQNDAGNNAAAEASFAKALLSAPNDGQTNFNMAIVKLALNKHTEALSYAKKAAGASPSNATYVYTLGLACEAAGDVDGAIGAYHQASSLDANYIRPRINLSSIYLAGGFTGEALRCLLEAYRVDPASFEVNNNLGAVYAREENWPSSVDHYGKALAAEPNNGTVRLNLARALAGAGSLEQARDTYRETLRISATNWDALFELGKTYVSLGDSDQAKRTFEDLLKRNPNYSGKGEAEKILAGL
jgi:tetratricopeptide (TPR) repeat protein